jgi:type VI secretion system protein ImpF
MAVAGKKDRLTQPFMLAFRSAHEARDAKVRVDLRNEHGERVIAGRRASGRSPVSEAVLRREVARDLGSLMNTIAMESSEDLTDLKRVRSSILNYGFPDIAHISIDETAVDGLSDDIQNVLMNYEPRLARASIRARRDTTIGAEELKIRFLVSADLICAPLNVPVEFVADVDLDGAVQINRL